MVYREKLLAAQQRSNSWLCVGLDPQPEKLALALWNYDDPVLLFNRRIIDATKDLVCAYKPNLGFYSQWGAAGMIALERTIAYIPNDIPVILDCKIGDIGHTQGAWGRGLYDEWQVDAITVNPYVGEAAVAPLLADRPDRAVYLLARTSNPGAQLFQGDLRQGKGLAADVIRTSQTWPLAGHLGYVVGATYPEELGLAREMAPDANFLIPGVGAQGGNLAAAVAHGADTVAGPVISVSRSIIYAAGGADFDQAARDAALAIREQINAARGV